MTQYLLFVISLADRVVEVLGVTAKPGEAWLLQGTVKLSGSALVLAVKVGEG